MFGLFTFARYVRIKMVFIKVPLLIILSVAVEGFNEGTPFTRVLYFDAKFNLCRITGRTATNKQGEYNARLFYRTDSRANQAKLLFSINKRRG